MKEERIIELVSNIGFDNESISDFSYSKYLDLKQKIGDAFPNILMNLYYSLNPSDENALNKFMTTYVYNESKLEGVNDEDVHGREEIAGLKKMYEYINSKDVDYLFDVYTLKDLHFQLFSCTDHPEFGGDFRNYPVYLPGTGTELTDWRMIREELNKLDSDIKKLYECAPKLKEIKNLDFLFEFLDKCVELECKLIKIHPFGDGNGRTIRGFINKLFKDAGLPLICIKSNERTEYQTAMNMANNEGNYDAIKDFYKYKVCDSIVEFYLKDKIEEYNESSVPMSMSLK